MVWVSSVIVDAAATVPAPSAPVPVLTDVASSTSVGLTVDLIIPEATVLFHSFESAFLIVWEY